MNCKDARSAILSGDGSAPLGDHLAHCAECRAAVPELERFTAALADPSMWEESSLSAGDLLRSVIGSRDPITSTRRTPKWVFGVAAAAIVVAAAASVFVLRGGGPDWSVPLVGAEAAPAASGIVEGWNVDGGSRLVLASAGLDPAPPGDVYELWFMSGDEAVSAGTFTDPARVQLMVGIAWREYPNVLVTLESPDGDPAPSETWLLWNAWDNKEGT